MELDESGKNLKKLKI